MSFGSPQFLSQTKRGLPRKVLPQVPRLIPHSYKSKTISGTHKFVNPASPQLALNISPLQHNSNKSNRLNSTIHEQTLKPLEDNIIHPSTPILNKDQHPNILYDKILDEFLTESLNSSLLESLERSLQKYFISNNLIIWVSIPELHVLYDYSNGKVTSQLQGIVGYAYTHNNTLKINKPSAHISYYSSTDSEICGSASSVLLFPLSDYNDHIYSIIEVVNSANEFDQIDENFATWFSKKFKLLSKWIMPTVNISEFVNEFLSLMPTEDYLKKVLAKMTKFFNCNLVEIWKMKTQHQLIKYFEKVETIPLAKAGIVSEALQKQITINTMNVQGHPAYTPYSDGREPQAVLAVPIIDLENNLRFSIVLRGPIKEKMFTKTDETNLKTLGPLLLLGLTNSENYTQINDDLKDVKREGDSFAALLEVAEVLSSQLNKDKLVETIMEKGRELTNADRCSLFLVNENRDKITTSLHEGLSEAIGLPIENGIAGKSIIDKKVYNISDPYKSRYFDSSIDNATGYTTKSILSVPIYNTRGEIIGVTEMVNKKDTENGFTESDEKVIQIFNVFCGISLDNSKLFKEATERDNQLRSFFNTALIMSKNQSLQKIMSEIMNNAKQSIDADRASIFLIKENSTDLETFISDNEKVPNSIPIDSGIFSIALKNQTALFVNDAYSNENFNKSIDEITNYKTKSVLASPIISSTDSIIGVVEMLNKHEGEFNDKDLSIIKAFSTFCSIALERNNSTQNTSNNHEKDVDVEMKKFISEDEMNKTTIPEKLLLTEDEKSIVSRLNCYAVDFKGIGHYKELFYFFDKFHLRETYKISNEVFYRFIYTISSTYNDVPYHNWTHACDVMQYIFYLSTTSHFDQRLTSMELYAMFIAAICHDANHRGFNNVFNVKFETPLGILFKDQSVMEMHHIETSIPIIELPDINLFHAFDVAETKKVWNLFIQTILATDMAHHFELVKKAQGLLDEKKWNWDEYDVRVLALQLVLKVADISNVSRPFEIADKWCDILNQEFFRQGDLEKSSGIGLTSPLNDRDNANKPKSQIGFYNFICLPLYTAIANIFPELQVNVDSLKSNLETWKKLAAAS